MSDDRFGFGSTGSQRVEATGDTVALRPPDNYDSVQPNMLVVGPDVHVRTSS